MSESTKTAPAKAFSKRDTTENKGTDTDIETPGSNMATQPTSLTYQPMRVVSTWPRCVTCCNSRNNHVDATWLNNTMRMAPSAGQKHQNQDTILRVLVVLKVIFGATVVDVEQFCQKEKEIRLLDILNPGRLPVHGNKDVGDWLEFLTKSVDISLTVAKTRLIRTSVHLNRNERSPLCKRSKLLQILTLLLSIIIPAHCFECCLNTRSWKLSQWPDVFVWNKRWCNAPFHGSNV